MDTKDIAGFVMLSFMLVACAVIGWEYVQNHHTQEMTKLCGCNVKECGK